MERTLIRHAHGPSWLRRSLTLRERRVSRRRVIFAGGSLAALIAVGCGDDDDTAGETPAAAASATSAPKRMFVHKFGETEIPENPQRVVSVGWDEHDLILTFGIVPILQRDAWGEQPFGTWPWALPKIGDRKPETFSDEELPYERIALLKPDLIMATWAGITEEDYQRLSAIAPTMAQHPDYEDWDAPWDVRALRVGEVFGQKEKARELVDGIGKRIAQIAADHPDWKQMKAVTVTRWDANLTVALEGHSRGKLLMDMGFGLPEAIAAMDPPEDGNNVEFSIERVNLLDTDLVIWVNGDDDASPIRDLPLRKTLNAHKEGREVYCDKVLTAAFSIQSPLSYNYLLDQLVPEIELAVDGDPATKVKLSDQYGLTA